MAKPIKETPVLYGKDAQRFDRILKENESKRVSASEYNRAINIYQKVMSKAKDIR